MLSHSLVRVSSLRYYTGLKSRPKNRTTNGLRRNDDAMKKFRWYHDLPVFQNK